jgi:hypothetical protein
MNIIGRPALVEAIRAGLRKPQRSAAPFNAQNCAAPSNHSAKISSRKPLQNVLAVSALGVFRRPRPNAEMPSRNSDRRSRAEISSDNSDGDNELAERHDKIGGQVFFYR